MDTITVADFDFPGTPALLQALVRQHARHNPTYRAVKRKGAPPLQLPTALREGRTPTIAPDAPNYRTELGNWDHGWGRLWLEATTTRPNHSHVIVTADPVMWPTMQPRWQELHEYITQHMDAKDGAHMPPLPISPPIPDRPKGWNPAEWAAIFEWCHQVGRDVCASLQELARLIKRPYATVRNKHAAYERDILSRSM